MDCPLFLVSYSEDGLLDADTMGALFSEFGEVRRYDFKHQRFKSNQGGAGGALTEFLYVVGKG
jgi:adenine-specific DNA-methyltransferase